MNKKILIGSIIAVALIVLSSFSSVAAIDTPKNRGNGDTLYVGGTGEGNYTKIQDAIDNASNGDRVLGKKVAENRTLEEQYKDALALEREGLVTITKVVKGEIGNPELLLAVWVELTQKGIQYIEENKKNW